MDTPAPAVMLLKGWTHGIESSSISSLVNSVSQRIVRAGVTDIAWDGDLVSNGSFTQVIEPLMELHNSLRFTIFKKDSSVCKLKKFYEEVDDYENTQRGYSFIDTIGDANTSYLSKGDKVKIYNCGARGSIIGFTNNDMAWFEMGLKGIDYIQSYCPRLVFALCIGKGENVFKEINVLKSAEYVKPDTFQVYEFLSCSRRNTMGIEESVPSHFEILWI